MRFPQTRVTVEGKPEAIITEALRKSEIAVTQAVASATAALKANWRGQVRASLGARLANAVRAEVYPKGGTSLDAAGLVYTKAPQIIGAHERGVTIRASNGVWLAIPLPAAGKGSRGARITPAEWERRSGLRLRFVYRRGRTSLLVADGRQNKRGLAVASRSKTGRGRATVPVFALVPQVTLKKVLDLKGAGQAAGATLSSRLRAGLRAQR